MEDNEKLVDLLSIDANKVDVEDLVGAAFDGPDQLRTLGGISRATTLPLSDVQRVLQTHPDIFVRSRTLTPSGSSVYSVPERKYRELQQKYVMKRQRSS